METVWKGSSGSQEGVVRLFGGYLEDVGSLSGGRGRLSGGCGEAALSGL